MTSVSPARAASNSRITHSGSPGAHTATRSPGVNRAASAPAARSASASSSEKVHRRRPAGSAAPATSAGASGYAAAASRKTPPTVVSRTGMVVSAGQYELVNAMAESLSSPSRTSPSRSRLPSSFRGDATYAAVEEVDRIVAVGAEVLGCEHREMVRRVGDQFRVRCALRCLHRGARARAPVVLTELVEHRGRRSVQRS